MAALKGLKQLLKRAAELRARAARANAEPGERVWVQRAYAYVSSKNCRYTHVARIGRRCRSAVIDLNAESYRGELKAVYTDRNR